MIPDKYIYFLFGVALLAVWTALYVLRPDMRVKLMRTSLAGVFAGPLAEFWYFQDYWRPPMFLVLGQITIEDCLVGFCITGIAATIYDVVFRTKLEHGARRYKRTFIAFFIVGLVLLTLFSRVFTFNSMLVSCIGFLAFAIVIVALRPELWRVSIWSGLLTLAVVLPIYVVLFDFVAPDYWSSYSTAVGFTLPGSSIPILEVAWYFSWGVLAGIGYEFAGGRYKVPYAKAAHASAPAGVDS